MRQRRQVVRQAEKISEGAQKQKVGQKLWFVWAELQHFREANKLG